MENYRLSKDMLIVGFINTLPSWPRLYSLQLRVGSHCTEMFRDGSTFGLRYELIQGQVHLRISKSFWFENIQY